MSENGKKKKFIFNTTGKITTKESKELKRTHTNIFDWAQKDKSKIAEKDNFESEEQAELEVEPMELDIMDKQERLDRVKRRAVTWETSRICRELVREMVDGVGKASAVSMVGSLVGEEVDKARSVGH